MAPADRIPLRLDAGPDAGRTIALADRLVLGRALGPGRVVDRTLEAHHLLLRRLPDGVEVLQLAGRVPVRVDGRPLGGPTIVGPGSVIEVGAGRFVVGAAATPQPTGTIRLGVGSLPNRTADIASRSFAEQAALDRAVTAGDVTIAPAAVRRLLVVGPGAPSLARAVAAQARAGGIAVHVARRVACLGRHTGTSMLVVTDLDLERDWPGALPVDGAVLRVGASWHAVLETTAGDDSISVHRFHAAGLAESGPIPEEIGGSAGGAVRPLVAQQVARPAAQRRGHIVGVPDPARCERQAAASDALVELVAQARQDGDLVVEPRSP